MAYDHLVDKMAHKIDRTRSDIKKIADRFPDPADAPVRPTPDPANLSVSSTPTPEPTADYSGIPLFPRREDYLDINHWTPDAWKAIQHPKKGDPTYQGPVPVNVLFWEDEFGNIIPPSRRKRVTRDLKVIWQDMHDKGRRLDCITKMGWETRQEFCTHIEEMQPWLRLCDDHWKADQLWTNTFTGWKPATEDRGKGEGKQLESLKRDRSAEEDEAGPSQKKARTEPQSATRPNPMKKPTAKVRCLPFITSTQLTRRTSRSARCELCFEFSHRNPNSPLPSVNVDINPAAHIVPITQVCISW